MKKEIMIYNVLIFFSFCFFFFSLLITQILLIIQTGGNRGELNEGMIKESFCELVPGSLKVARTI
jgi:hypothetical protein